MTLQQSKSQISLKQKVGGTALIILLLLQIYLIEKATVSDIYQYQIFCGNLLQWWTAVDVPVVRNPENMTAVVVTNSSISESLGSRNSSSEGSPWLHAWKHLNQIDNISDSLPYAAETIKEARVAWENLTITAQNESSQHTGKEKQGSIHKDVDLLIGISSKASNFERRMAVRRTWMQYNIVGAGSVAVQFFVGLDTKLTVNKELWHEAQTYGDIQVLPFVDHYSLITWKTLAICIYGTSAVSANFLMKTDDDSFVRVDEIHSSVKQLNVSHGLLYGRIDAQSGPQRNNESKWYISPEEWPDDEYPPWAHGPGYVVSQDIAKTIVDWHKTSRLKMFKLEDVAMGIWVNEMKEGGLHVRYQTDDRIHADECKYGYIVAHYQEPRQMLCLWEKLQETNQATCCNAN